MHSKSKLRQYFPYVNQKALQAFYGDFRECFGKRKDEWMVRDEDIHFNNKNDNSYIKWIFRIIIFSWKFAKKYFFLIFYKAIIDKGQLTSELDRLKEQLNNLE